MPFKQRHPRTERPIRPDWRIHLERAARWDRFNEWLEGPGYRGLVTLVVAGCFALVLGWWWGR